MIINGNYTEMAENSIFSDKYITSEQSRVYLENKENFITFSKGISREMARLGLGTNPDEHRKILKKMMKENGLAPANETLVNWFKESKPNREYAFKICFSLGFDHVKTDNFLNRVCFYNSFNFKDPKEVIFFYCLKHNIKYSDALQFYESYNRAPATPKDDSELPNTKQIQQIVTEFHNNSALLDFLIKNKAAFSGYGKTALENYFSLKQSLIEEIQIFHKDRECIEKDAITNDYLLKTFFDGIPKVWRNETEMSTDNERVTDFISLQKSSLVADTVSDFPLKQHLFLIEEGKLKDGIKVKTPVSRKAIIIFNFFIFCYRTFELENVSDLYDRFFVTTQL